MDNTFFAYFKRTWWGKVLIKTLFYHFFMEKVQPQPCLLFNLALERAIRDSRVETTGTIFYKSTQILA